MDEDVANVGNAEGGLNAEDLENSAENVDL